MKLNKQFAQKFVGLINGSPDIHSMGRRMMTQSQLNMSWMVAPANALRNSFLSIDWNMATIVFVTDVPMLAPITMKMAGLMGKTATEFFNA